VVDDEKELRELLKELLKNYSLTVFAALFIHFIMPD